MHGSQTKEGMSEEKNTLILKKYMRIQERSRQKWGRLSRGWRFGGTHPEPLDTSEKKNLHTIK